MVFTAHSLEGFFEGLYMKKRKAQGTRAKFSCESLRVMTGQVLVNVQFVSLAFAAALACALVDLEFLGGIAWFGTVTVLVFLFARELGNCSCMCGNRNLGSVASGSSGRHALCV